MPDFEKILSGGDLRSIGESNLICSKIKNQTDFDALFKFLFHSDRLIVMRAADVVEKVTIAHPYYLLKYKKDILALCDLAESKELKWHLALLIPRLPLDAKELTAAWSLLTRWVTDKTNSRIVRVNALQALYDLAKQDPELGVDFTLTVTALEKERIPSIDARIKKLQNAARE